MSKEWVSVWPSGKLPFEFQNWQFVEKNDNFCQFFWKNMSSFWQFSGGSAGNSLLYNVIGDCTGLCQWHGMLVARIDAPTPQNYFV